MIEDGKKKPMSNGVVTIQRSLPTNSDLAFASSNLKFYILAFAWDKDFFCPHGICFFQSEILHSFNFPKTNFSVGMKPVFNLPWKSRCNFLQKRILAIWNFTFIQFSEDELFSGAWNRYLISLENLFLFPSNLYINFKKRWRSNTTISPLSIFRKKVTAKR